MIPGMAMGAISVGRQFPIVRATNVSTAASSSTPAANLPADIAAGNLLLVFHAVEGTRTIDTPSTWTELFQANTGGSNDVTIKGIYKIASGSEGSTVTISHSGGASASAANSYRITGYESTPQSANVHHGTGNNPDPPSLTPSWAQAEPILWIAVSLVRGNDTPSGYPTNYVGGITSGGTVMVVSSATRDLFASTTDPGAFTQTVDTRAYAATVAVRGV